MMDSLRYWVLEMHVDGFRFDLASTLARELHEVNQLGTFFNTIRQDPVLSTIKLIAETWDLGEGGYQVGNFPMGWSEWNDKYRDVFVPTGKAMGGLLGEYGATVDRLQRPVRTQWAVYASIISSVRTTGLPCMTWLLQRPSTTRPIKKITGDG